MVKFFDVNNAYLAILLVTFSGWLNDPLKWLSDLQLGDEKVTLNHLNHLTVSKLILLMEEIPKQPPGMKKKPVNNGIDCAYQLVQNFYHQQYDSNIWSNSINMWFLPPTVWFYHQQYDLQASETLIPTDAGFL